MDVEAGSFRDPAGFIFRFDGKLYRQVNRAGQADYDAAVAAGFYRDAMEAGWLVEHQEVTPPTRLPADPNRYKILKPSPIPFISYPYEWSFGQLKTAALTTLKVQREALRHGLILKDASAYNIQFIGTQPVFIDTLSFAAYQPGDAWEGYKQFCEHFIAPLALAHYSSAAVLKLLRVYIDGLPLETACQLLPRRARLQRGLAVHLYLHNTAQRKHQRGGAQVAGKSQQRKVSSLAMDGLLASLERTVKKLTPPSGPTEWGDYYNFTNYSDQSFQQKKRIITGFLKQVSPASKLIWDLGANTGEFSELAAATGSYTVAFDIDTQAVERNYLAHQRGEFTNNLLPLVADLTNPSPALGWGHGERSSLLQRGPADVVLALALIHHLAIGNNVPLPAIADFLRHTGTYVIIEFIPKTDSKVQHLLASRKDIFDTYDAAHFEAAMNKHFTLVAKKGIPGSKRSLYLYKAVKRP